MNSEKNLINVENGGRKCQCKYKQTYKLFKYLLIACLVLDGLLLAWCVRLEVQTYNARDCTGRSEDVEESKALLQEREQDRSTPRDDHIAREKRSSQVQAQEKDEIKMVDPEDESDIMLKDDSSSSHRRKEVGKVRKSGCQCSEEQLNDMVRKVVAQAIESKIRHRRSKGGNDRRGSTQRRRQRKPKSIRVRRTTNTTSSEPIPTTQSIITSANADTNANAQPAPLTYAQASVPRLPLFHMTGKEVDSVDPLQTLNSTDCPECRVIEHGYLDRNNRFKPSHEMYKSWDVDQTISDHSIARMADGTVTIKKTGIYLVYAQIVFYNSIIYNGVAIKVNGEEKTRCFQHGPASVNTPNDGSRPTPFHNAVFSTCNPFQPMYLQEYDNLTFVSLQNDSWTHFNPLTSYWGLIMLNDVLPSTPAPTQ